MRRPLAALATAALVLATAPRVGAQSTADAVRGGALQVFLMTVGPGADTWERFGHNAIWIRDTVLRRDAIYNFGTFDFAAPGFYWQFVMRTALYELAVDNGTSSLDFYREQRRNVNAQELDLSPAARGELARMLEQNALPANRYYLYDYFRDNCSTRVRDALDTVLGGALRRATQGKPAQGTLRFHALRSVTNQKLLYLGIDAGLGPSVDRPLDQWGEMFLPEKVAARMRELRVPGPAGALIPVVKHEWTMVKMDVYHVDAAPPRWGFGFLGVGLALALLIATGSVRGRAGIPGRAIGIFWLVLSGAAGLMMLFLWFGTGHVAARSNHNILLLSPFALALVPAYWSRGGDRAVARYTWVAGIVLFSIAIGVALALFPSIGVQRNLAIAALVVPPGLAATLDALRRVSGRDTVVEPGEEAPSGGTNELPPA